MSGQPMAHKVISKVNARLKFLHRKNKCLTSDLPPLLCNALLQPHFDYACSAWYLSRSKKFKINIRTSRNRCIRYCLRLDKVAHISQKEFEAINWFRTKEKFN